jgi:hypothetical protein
LAKDINILVTSMLEHKTYENIAGRTLDDNKYTPLDIISKGYGILAHGVPRDSIGEFNAKFVKLQQRTEVRPLTVQLPSEIIESQTLDSAQPCLLMKTSEYDTGDHGLIQDGAVIFHPLRSL